MLYVGTVVVPTVASLAIIIFVGAILLLCVKQYLLFLSVYIYHAAISSDR